MNTRTHAAGSMVPLIAGRFPLDLRRATTPCTSKSWARRTPNGDEVPPASRTRMSTSLPRPVDLPVAERANNQQATRLVIKETRQFMHPLHTTAVTHPRPSAFVTASVQIPGHAPIPAPYAGSIGVSHGRFSPCGALHGQTRADSPTVHSTHVRTRHTQPTRKSTPTPRRPAARQMPSATSSTCHRAHMLARFRSPASCESTGSGLSHTQQTARSSAKLRAAFDVIQAKPPSTPIRRS